MKKIIMLLFSTLSIMSCLGQTNNDDFYSGLDKYRSFDYEGAIEDFTMAIWSSSEPVESYYYRGLAKHKLKDYSGAIQDFNSALGLDQRRDIFNSRGLAKYRLGDYRGAIADYNKSLTIPGVYLVGYNVTIYFNRGVAKHALKDYSGAIVDYDKAIEDSRDRSGDLFPEKNNPIEEFPGFAEIYYWRGLARIELGQKDSGCLDLSKAGELGYGNAYDKIKELCN